MSKPVTTDKDLGYGAIMKQVKSFKDKPYVKVGVQSDAGNEDDGTPIVVAAATNEYGSMDGHIPARSFIRSAIDMNRDDLDKLTAFYVGQISLGRLDAEKALRYLGESIQAKIQRRITSNIQPKNADGTIKRKGEGKGTLIDTTHLLKSIRYVLVLKGDK